MKRDEGGVVAPSRVVLVVIVLIAIAGATWIAGLAPDQRDASASTTAKVRASQTPTTSASVTSPSAQATGATTPKPAATSESKAAAAPLKRNQVSVSVFNNSSRKGLAARTSGTAKKAGWRVLGSDNWYGTIPASTVYYPAALKSSASLLAKDLGIARVKPSVKPMRNDRLTVIVTSDYRS